MKKAIFPGSFDPFTLGHASIVERALAFMDVLYLGIGVNEEKQTMLTPEERLKTLQALYAEEPRVIPVLYRGLTTDWAQEVGATFLIRGVRNVLDFEYEKNLADINRRLTGIETLVLFTEPQYSCISSSMVRELIHYGKPVDEFLPHPKNK